MASHTDGSAPCPASAVDIHAEHACTVLGTRRPPAYGASTSGVALGVVNRVVVREALQTATATAMVRTVYVKVSPTVAPGTRGWCVPHADMVFVAQPCVFRDSQVLALVQSQPLGGVRRMASRMLMERVYLVDVCGKADKHEAAVDASLEPCVVCVRALPDEADATKAEVWVCGTDAEYVAELLQKTFQLQHMPVVVAPSIYDKESVPTTFLHTQWTSYGLAAGTPVLTICHSHNHTMRSVFYDIGRDGVRGSHCAECGTITRNQLERGKRLVPGMAYLCKRNLAYDAGAGENVYEYDIVGGGGQYAAFADNCCHECWKKGWGNMFSN